MIPDYLLRRPDSAEINALPLYSYKGKVHIVRSRRDWKNVCRAFAAEEILGFDTETRPTFQRGKSNAPAIVQLASSDAVYIFQLHDFPFGHELASILANPAQIKAGVATRDDILALAKVYPFEAAGVVDLGQVAKAHDIPNHGLRTLAASLFGWRISKGPQCSNWNVKNLSNRQIAYAATDAWISRLIYLRMRDLGLLENTAYAS